MKKLKRNIKLLFVKVARRLQSIQLPFVKNITVWDFVKIFTQQINKEGLSIRAAAISFNFTMAIPPLVLFLATLVPYLPVANDLFEELSILVKTLTPNPTTQDMVLQFLDNILNKPKGGLLSLGALLTLFYASNGMMAIIESFDKSINEQHKNSFIASRLRAVMLTIIVVFLLIGTLLILVGQGAFFNSIIHYFQWQNSIVITVIQYFRWVFVALLFYCSIAFIYKYAPSVEKRKSWLSLGALVATVLIILTTIVFSYWASNFSQLDKFYGTIGNVILLVNLIFFDAMMLLVGYELDNSIERIRERIKENK